MSLSEMSFKDLQALAKSLGLKSVGVSREALEASVAEAQATSEAAETAVTGGAMTPVGDGDAIEGDGSGEPLPALEGEKACRGCGSLSRVDGLSVCPDCGEEV